MRTKTEIKKTYLEQKSMNRITDKWSLKAINKLSEMAVDADVKINTENIVDCAYDLELASECASALGRKGGKSKSPAKRKASAENGKKGGRPKKN
jgi:hypothetical protein